MEKIYELKPQVGKIEVELEGDLQYIITREVNESGVIIITCTPSDLIAKELESLLNSIAGEFGNLEASKANIDERLVALEKEKLNIEELVKNIGR